MHFFQSLHYKLYWDFKRPCIMTLNLTDLLHQVYFVLINLFSTVPVLLSAMLNFSDFWTFCTGDDTDSVPMWQVRRVVFEKKTFFFKRCFLFFKKNFFFKKTLTLRQTNSYSKWRWAMHALSCLTNYEVAKKMSSVFFFFF